MTNPDREELFTPDELAVRLDEWANCLDRSQMDLRSDMRCAAIHLRRLASSDSGEPVAWIAFASTGLIRFWTSDRERADREKASGLDLHAFSLAELVALAAKPAQPADAGMREAVAYAEHLAVVLWSKHFKDIAPHWKPLTGDLIGLLTQIDNMTTALTAPGATTKSDGENIFVRMADDSGMPSMPSVTENINLRTAAEIESAREASKSDGGARSLTADETRLLEQALRDSGELVETLSSPSDPLAGKVPCHCHDAVSVCLCLDRDRCYTVEAQPIHAIKMPEYRYQEQDQRGGNVSFGNYSEFTPVTVRGSTSVPTLVDDANSASGKHVEYQRPSDPSSTRSEVTVEIKHLISSARAFLAHFNPYDLAEDKSQQWQSLEHQCNRVERALLNQFEIRGKK